ncbi:DUF480 domain-containing protein [Aeoliella mucimassa]|uniref:DUF480 domain-containing protein n=1 Tax=Aeoliella mucimassa TaxID=2527972 RepID=A0A518AJR6_9BACT|nr:DUF480 domain-containing protein [Aeoliella mucimassa]QDU54979.1 hypothetical protein Pan181_11640 [Aeoliella mucimassa]
MDAEDSSPKWTQLEANERRVLGVLIEKAKTTPDAYPLTLKGLVTGSNQKRNRFPQMTLEEDHVEDAIDSLRTKGAVSIIQGDGRVEKYRHLAYDWLGVSKVELAIMGELLLRGAQTIGELRGRAARMEPIKGMAELGPLLESLLSKSLVVYLTPPGRGAVVTHNLYQPREMDKVRREHGVAMPGDTSDSAPSVTPPAASSGSDAASLSSPATTSSNPAADKPPVVATSPPTAVAGGPSAAAELAGLREEVAHLRSTLAAFQDEAEQSIADLQQQLADLQRQLGV